MKKFVRCTVETKVSHDSDARKKLVAIMEEFGVVKGASGGFPLSPMAYSWEGREEGLAKIKEFGAEILGVEYKVNERKVGFYGGKFLPIHMGHVYSMVRASTMVDELHIIVSYDPEYEKKLFEGAKMEHVPHRIRKRWWTELTKDMPHVHVHAVYEEQTGQFSDWEKGAEGIKKAIGKPIDTVFSSEEVYGEFFEKLYPTAEHVVIDPNRFTYPISGTKIRMEGAIKHWNMLPDIVKPYFAKSVVVIGTESCGKSTMVKNLATLFNTTYTEEFGRTFYERLGGFSGIELESDFHEIAFEHKYHEKMQLAKANKVLFVDTEALVTQYYAMLSLGHELPILEEVFKLQNYDLWIFLEPDVAWVDDGSRCYGEESVRQENNKILKELLKRHNVEYTSISGDYEQRLEVAVMAVQNLLEG